MLSEGQILDDTYRLLRRVAEGAMGVVYEATHARLAGRYAIKVLTPQLAESPEGLAHSIEKHGSRRSCSTPTSSR